MTNKDQEAEDPQLLYKSIEKMTIGQSIKKQRESMGLTVTRLETLSGVKNTAIINIENDSSNYTRITLEKVCNVLGLEICLKKKK